MAAWAIVSIWVVGVATKTVSETDLVAEKQRNGFGGMIVQIDLPTCYLRRQSAMRS